MTKKGLKLNIKNTQIAEALNLKKVSLPKKSVAKKATAKAAEEKEPVRRARIIVEEKIPEPLPTLEEENPSKKKTGSVPKTEAPSPIEEKVAVEEKRTLPSETVEGKKETIKPKEISPEEKKQKIEKLIELEKTELKKGKKKGPLDFEEEEAAKKFKSFKDIKTLKAPTQVFDSRDKMGLRSDYEQRWRKKRQAKHRPVVEIPIIRPKNLSIRLPITVKDLAQEMKLKATEIISKLFVQGVILTINDCLDDATTVQFIGHEFECEIRIDKDEEKRLQVTSQTIKEEIEASSNEDIIIRPPVVTFMGHVDHGKTSLIDAIRKSNIVATEAGAITQHIGAFTVTSSFGKITILDTPGHEAFTEMRSRGALVTDIVVLVIAGDEGMKEQTIESIQQAKSANVQIVVAINKCDKSSFDAEKVYRQLADHELLPEVWGGTTITINCSAATKKGIPELLEMLSLQSEILELKANPKARARGIILESQMHKSYGPTATVLVQNGTLKTGDAVLFGNEWGRVKTMYDEYNRFLYEAGPSTPAKITGLSSLPEAGCDFIVVENEKTAKELAEARAEGQKRKDLQQTKKNLDAIIQQSKSSKDKKILPVILIADVQGSLEALKIALGKLPNDKVLINIVKAAVGEISESDVMLASASKAVIIGFHTHIENHATPLIKELKVAVSLQDVIYHAVDEIKKYMKATLDKIKKEYDTGTAIVQAIFKSSQFGNIAGCRVTDGQVKRTSHIRQIREGKEIWKGKISSLKRAKEDTKEVQKGVEFGIVLDNNQDLQIEDTLQAYDVVYLEQEL